MIESIKTVADKLRWNFYVRTPGVNPVEIGPFPQSGLVNMLEETGTVDVQRERYRQYDGHGKTLGRPDPVQEPGAEVADAVRNYVPDDVTPRITALHVKPEKMADKTPEIADQIDDESETAGAITYTATLSWVDDVDDPLSEYAKADHRYEGAVIVPDGELFDYLEAFFDVGHHGPLYRAEGVDAATGMLEALDAVYKEEPLALYDRKLSGTETWDRPRDGQTAAEDFAGLQAMGDLNRTTVTVEADEGTLTYTVAAQVHPDDHIGAPGTVTYWAEAADTEEERTSARALLEDL